MINTHSILLTLHVARLVCSLGTALLLDLRLLPAWRGRRPAHPAAIDVFTLGAGIVTLGLPVLWASGLGLVALGLKPDAGLRQNLKLLAKLIIVALLTLNGVLPHLRVLPLFVGVAGRTPRLGSDRAARVPLASCGALSLISWDAAFLFGMLRSLNHVVPVSTLTGACLFAVLLAWAAALALLPPGPAARLALGPDGQDPPASWQQRAKSHQQRATHRR